MLINKYRNLKTLVERLIHEAAYADLITCDDPDMIPLLIVLRDLDIITLDFKDQHTSSVVFHIPNRVKLASLYTLMDYTIPTLPVTEKPTHM